MAKKTRIESEKVVKHTKTTRGLASRKPEDYDNRTEGRRSSSIPPGDFTLNEGLAPVNLIRPKYNEGPLVLRPWPCLDYEHPETMLQPARRSVEPRAQTNWLVRMMTASYVGIREGGGLYTFNLYHPKDKEGKIGNPYRIFHRACEQAHDAGKFGLGRRWNSEWNKLLKGSKNSGAAISPPKVKWFIQGHCYINGDKLYVGGDSERELPLGLDPKDDLTVFQISDTAGDGLMDLLDVKKAEWEGDEEADPTLPFKYGSAVGRFDQKKRVLHGGLFVTVFNPKKTKIKKATSWSGEIKEIQGYESAVSRIWTSDGVDYTPDIDSKGVDQIFAKSQFWFDDPESNSKGILRIAPVEQQCLWIAQAFKPVPKLVLFAFVDREEFLTAEVKAVLRNRVSMVVPGDDEDDEDDETTTKKKGKKTDPVAKMGKKAVEEDEFDDADDDDASDDEKDDEWEDKSTKLSKKSKDEDEDDDFDDDSDDEDDDSDEDDDDDYDDEDDDSDDEDDDDSDDEDYDSDDEDDDDSDHEDDDDADEDAKSAKKGSKGSPKKSSKGGSKKGNEEDYFDIDDKIDDRTSKSAKAAKEAKGRSEKRSQAPKKAPPKPPLK